MLDCFSLIAIVGKIVNKHHIRKIYSKIMLILVFCFISNRWCCYSKPTQSSTVKHIVLVVYNTQHPPFIKILIEKSCSIGTLFKFLKHLVVNVYIYTVMALSHILADNLFSYLCII